MHSADRGSSYGQGCTVYASSGTVARRLKAPLRETNSRRNGNGGATTQPLANQPTNKPTNHPASQPPATASPSPRSVVATPVHPRDSPPPGHENHAERGAVYRHAPDKLEGVSAGGITSPGKNSPSVSLYRCTLVRRGGRVQKYDEHRARSQGGR